MYTGKYPVLKAAPKDVNESQVNKFEFESCLSHIQKILRLPSRKHTVPQLKIEGLGKFSRALIFVRYEKKNSQYPNVRANYTHSYHWALKC
jgi:hypothetical protein